MSVDLAGFSETSLDFSIEFIGYKAGSGVVSQVFTGEGLNFKTYSFGPEFTDLIRVEIPGDGWSMDNLVFAIPEPTTGSVLLMGGLLLWAHTIRAVRKKGAAPSSLP